jgi:hypothetical protein
MYSSASDQHRMRNTVARKFTLSIAFTFVPREEHGFSFAPLTCSGQKPHWIDPVFPGDIAKRLKLIHGFQITGKPESIKGWCIPNT